MDKLAAWLQRACGSQATTLPAHAGMQSQEPRCWPTWLRPSLPLLAPGRQARLASVGTASDRPHARREGRHRGGVKADDRRKYDGTRAEDERGSVTDVAQDPHTDLKEET
jgi:hypothetical protein